MKKLHIVPGLFLILFLIFGVSSYSLALEVPVFSPLRYSINDVQGTAVYTDTFTMGNVVSGEFHLVVQNGSGGANKVDLAEVSIDGKILVKLTSKKDFKDKKFKLLKDSELRISLTGQKNSFVVVSIIARKLTQVPLVIRMPQADAQTAMTAALLKIKKKPTFASHGFVPSGSVISQTPSPGVYVKEKTKASITVSTGPALAYNLLPGTPDTPASSAVADYNSYDTVPDAEIEGLSPDARIARTKLEIGFISTATVKEVNDLLTSIGAQITSMLTGVSQVIVRIPDPGNLDALDTLVTFIQSNPIVRYVLKGHMTSPGMLPPNVDVLIQPGLMVAIDHHLDARAHAAWNVRGLLDNAQRPYLLVADEFGNGPPNADFAVTSDWRDFTTASLNSHGYHVLGIIAGTFGGPDTDRGWVTGMYPGPLLLWAVDLKKGIDSSTMDSMIQNLVTLLGGNIVLNTSLQVQGCKTNIPDGLLDKSCIVPMALSWIEKVRGSALFDTGQWGSESLENTFLHLTAAGNIHPAQPYDTDATYGGPYAAARLHANLETGIILPTHIANLNNTLVIENRVKSPTPLEGLGCISPDSKYPGNLSGIGTNVWSLTGATNGAGYLSGTSMATPQVAGLAAYLWALKPWAAPQGIMDILMHTADTSTCGGAEPRPLIDAYAAVLAIDRSYSDSRVRRTLLDVADSSGISGSDGHFTEKDIELFLDRFDAASGDKDYSRYDLNGDGKTGGDTKAKLNLDMNYPFTYTTVSQKIEETSVSFDENSLTDLEILCYYAYSPLYTGDATKLKELLENKCTPCEEVGDGFEEGLTANYSNGRQAFEGPINHGYDESCPADSSYEYNMYQNVCTPLSLSPVHWAKGGWDGEDDTTAFNVSWNGYLFAPKEGAYYFGGWVDGIIHIEIDGQVVANMDTMGESYGYTMTLPGRSWVPISMSFETNGGSNNMRLKWRVPGVSSAEYVPRGCLKH